MLMMFSAAMQEGMEMAGGASSILFSVGKTLQHTDLSFRTICTGWLSSRASSTWATANGAAGSPPPVCIKWRRRPVAIMLSQSARKKRVSLFPRLFEKFLSNVVVQSVLHSLPTKLGAIAFNVTV
jgi:hypothetical protein